MNRIFSDLRYGLRMLRKDPGFTVTATLILALGIAGNTVIFTFLDSYLLRPLPAIRAQKEFVRVGRLTDAKHFGTITYRTYLDFAENNDVLSGLAAYSLAEVNFSGPPGAERVLCGIVSGNYFSVLGVSTILGRPIAEQDARTAGAEAVVVISYKLWTRRFQRDPNVVGQTVKVNRHPFTVIGVAPKDFRGTWVEAALDLWVPTTMQRQAMQIPMDLLTEPMSWLWLAGRLKPGTSVEQAQANFTVLAQGKLEDDPLLKNGMLVLPGLGLHPTQYRGLRSTFLQVLGAGGLVLLIACANVAILLLARGAARAREISVRLAVGANRGQLLGQMLIESLLLALPGGAVGALLAYASAGIVGASFTYQTFSRPFDFRPDVRALTFTLILSALTALTFGLAPALRSARLDLMGELRGVRGASPQSSRLQQGLVVLQIALSMVLLVASGLLLQSLRNYQKLDPGFDTRNVLVVAFDFARNGFDEAAARRVMAQAGDRVRTLPGVETVSFAAEPLSHSTGRFLIDGQASSGAEGVPLDYDLVGPDFFRTLGLPLLKGRDFDTSDRADSAGVAIVSESLARRLWPDREALGARITRVISLRPDQRRWGESVRLRSPVFTVVGVVGNRKMHTHGAVLDTAPEQPMVYLPLEQIHSGSVMLVRSAVRPENLVQAVIHETRTLAPDLPLNDVRSLADRLAAALAGDRFVHTLVGVFGALALVLAASGLYAALAYMVARRTAEVGIRMALGARPGQVTLLIVGKGLSLVGVGIAAGVAGSLAVQRAISSRLYGVSPTDPLVFLAVALLLGFAGLLASYIPARRAASVDPLVALRSE